MFSIQLTLESDLRVQIIGNKLISQIVKTVLKRINTSKLYEITPFYSSSLLPLDEALLFIVIAEVHSNKLDKKDVEEFRLALQSFQTLRENMNTPKLLLFWIEDSDNNLDNNADYLLFENTWLKAEQIADIEYKLQTSEELENRLYTSVMNILQAVDDQRRQDFESELKTLKHAKSQSSTPKRFDERINALEQVLSLWQDRTQVIEKGIEAQQSRINSKDKDTDAANKTYISRVATVGPRLYDSSHYFRDRDNERKELSQAIASRGTKIISVIGFGGIGKSALVSKVLSDLELHGVWNHSSAETLDISGIVYMSAQTNQISLERIFLDLSEMQALITQDKKSKEDLLAIWRNSSYTTQDKIDALLRQFQDDIVIVLWDNFETYLDDTNKIQDTDLSLFFEAMLRSPTGLRFVVTTRRPINFPENLRAFDKQISVHNGLPETHAVEMLKDLDTNGKSGLSAQSNELLSLAVQKVNGVPRALEIINSILAKSPLLKLETLLSEDMIFEDKDFVTKLVEANYGYLDNYSRKVLEAIAVFDRPTTLEAIDYMLQPFVKGIDTPAIVQNLFEIALINVERSTGTITLHPVDKTYIYQNIPKNGEYSSTTLHKRAAEYLLRRQKPEDMWVSIDDLQELLFAFNHLVSALDHDTAAELLVNLQNKDNRRMAPNPPK